MSFDEIHPHWDRRPFQPFEIEMADGSVHVLTHPRRMLMAPDASFLIYVSAHGPSRRLMTAEMRRVSRCAE